MSRDERESLVFELYTTEKYYVQCLVDIEECYMNPLKEALSSEEIASIFGNIPIIRSLNEEFLIALKSSTLSWGPESLIADEINWITPYFKMYISYYSSFEDSMIALDKVVSKRPRIKELLKDIQARPNTNGLDLKALLIMPIQRIPRYRLLVKGLVGATPEGHPDLAGLTLALERISAVTKTINDSIDARQNREKILEIQQMFVGKDMPQLVSPGRVFLRSGELTKVCRGGNKVRYFFLFTDLLIYGLQLHKNSFLFRRAIDIDGSFVVVAIPSKLSYNGFQIRNKKKSFVVHAGSLEDKSNWLEAFSRCIVHARKHNLRTMNSSEVAAPIWQPNSSADECGKCGISFSFLNRRHHCRQCGRIFCGTCSKKKLRLDFDPSRLHRTCDLCFDEITSDSSIQFQTETPLYAGKEDDSDSSVDYIEDIAEERMDIMQIDEVEKIEEKVHSDGLVLRVSVVRTINLTAKRGSDDHWGDLAYQAGDRVTVLLRKRNSVCVENLRTSQVGWVDPEDFAE